MSGPKIDIKKPGGFSGGDMKLIALVIGLVGLISVGAYFYKTYFMTPQKKDQRELMIQSGVDPSYYAYEAEEGGGSKGEGLIDGYFSDDGTELTPEEWERQEEKKRKKEEKAEKKRQKELASQTQYQPTAKRKPTAEDLFWYEDAPKVDPRKLAAQQINSARAGSLQVRVKVSPEEIAAQREASTEIKNTQEDFAGVEGEIEASFPVDLSRVLTADRRITAVLENDVASELGGKITAIVTENVYAAHGDKILIPGGSKVIGFYRPLNKIGQERLEFIIPRIITPNGINIHLGDGEIADAMGRSGISGEIDRRYTERYGMAFLVSLVNAAAMYNIDVKNANQQLVVQNTGSEISTLSKAILEDHLNIKPRVNIPHGSIIHITAQKDIWFKPAVKNEIFAIALNKK